MLAQLKEAEKHKQERELLVQLREEVVGPRARGADHVVNASAPHSSFLQIPAAFFLQQHQRSLKRQTKQSKLQDREKDPFPCKCYHSAAKQT
jgi:hypothetical protein